jgi:hypothetical protein
MRVVPTKAILFFMLSLSTALLAAQDTRFEETGKSPVEAKFAPNGQVRMHLCPSGVSLIGRDDGVLRVSYHPPIEGVKVRLQISGSEAKLRVTGCPHNNFQLTVEVPRSSGLHVRMFAGQLDVLGVTGDKDVELSFGQLTMEVGEPDDYSHLDASVSSGELDAAAFNVNKGGLFRSFDHNGPGKYRLHAHVGAGQLDLR